MIWDLWWVWIVAAGGLAVLEILLQVFGLLGLALGALLVGPGLGLGILGGSLPVVILVFATGSLTLWIVLRRVMGVRAGQVKHWDHDIIDSRRVETTQSGGVTGLTPVNG